jgi:hypothetical protein
LLLFTHVTQPKRDRPRINELLPWNLQATHIASLAGDATRRLPAPA